MKILLNLILLFLIAFGAHAQYTLEHIASFLHHQPVKVLYWYNYQGNEFLPLKLSTTFENDSVATKYQIVTTKLRSFSEGYKGAGVFYYVPEYALVNFSLQKPDKEFIDYLETDRPIANTADKALAVEDSIRAFGTELSQVIDFKIENKIFRNETLPTYLILDAIFLAGSYYGYKNGGSTLKGVGYYSLGILSTALFFKTTFDLTKEGIRFRKRKSAIRSFNTKVQKYSNK